MAKRIPIILLLLVLSLTLIVAAQAPNEKRKTVLDVLKAGQKVAVTFLVVTALGFAWGLAIMFLLKRSAKSEFLR